MTAIKISPTVEELEQLAETVPPGPVVIINLLKFKDDPGAREAYARYMQGAAKASHPDIEILHAGSAAAEISSYRRARGLSAVSLDSELMGIAKSHSDAMARANKMSHVLWGEGSFQRRLSRGGYNAAIAVENVAAGHRTFAEAFAGWKASRGHNANLLKPGVTQMGIAVAFTPKSNYGNFWTLILAEPDNRQSTLGSEAGPRVAAPG